MGCGPTMKEFHEPVQAVKLNKNKSEQDKENYSLQAGCSTQNNV